jgi:protein-S-isoprenylcysteine O-methyltransferase Ste14
MHASYTASTTVIFRPLGTGASFLAFGYVMAAVLWSAVAVVAVANGWWVPRRAIGSNGILARVRGIVKDLMRNRNGMDIVGQGGKIILFMLPALVAAIAVHAYLPQVAALPGGIGVIRLLGYPLLLAGLALWGAAVVQLMGGFPKGKLVTTGAYGVVRNPIYSSMAWFILPAVALITMTWVYLVASVFLYVGVMVLIGKEEEGLAKVFGREYEDYTARVDRMVPFKGYFRGSRTAQQEGDASL